MYWATCSKSPSGPKQVEQHEIAERQADHAAQRNVPTSVRTTLRFFLARGIVGITNGAAGSRRSPTREYRFARKSAASSRRRFPRPASIRSRRRPARIRFPRPAQTTFSDRSRRSRRCRDDSGTFGRSNDGPGAARSFSAVARRQSDRQASPTVGRGLSRLRHDFRLVVNSFNYSFNLNGFRGLEHRHRIPASR